MAQFCEQITQISYTQKIKFMKKISIKSEENGKSFFFFFNHFSPMNGKFNLGKQRKAPALGIWSKRQNKFTFFDYLPNLMQTESEIGK